VQEEYLKDLNDVQHKAVTSINGPSLVIAGAGSGKTRVLTYRIAYLLSKGNDPRSILSLTFTNKAAKEMKERIGQLVGFEVARKLWMGTFHSIFSKILRREADKLGYSSNFTIYDTQDSKSLVKSIIKEMKLDDQTYKVNEVYGRISSSKNNLVTARAYVTNDQIMKIDAMNRKPKIADIYKLYALRCKKADAMDFDDLLLNTNILFRDFPEVLKKYQDSFRYILVDEYQDTNYAQYLIVKKLAAHHKNVCVVGDDAQSIYSFRGAKIENILNFRNDYPGYNIFKLEQNYRSTQNIVNAANSLIIKNKDQIKKKVWSANDTGTKIQVLEASTDNEEGFLVAGAINDTIYREQVQYRDIAILYRTNAQSRIFEEALRKKNIPYKVFGSLSFYQRKEIKDLLSYCRLTVNPNDTEALKRVINYPARGIGNTTQGRIEEYANLHDVSMWEIVSQPDEYPVELNAGVKKKLVAFSNLIKSFQSLLAETDAYELANHIANASGILEDLHFKNTPENLSKYENLQELLNSIKEFTDNRAEDEVKSLDYYLENVALLTDADNEKEEDINKVSIMTIHASKGLEFDYVFIAGLEEELFPSRMSITLPQDLEEERRLFYVAITRARKQATLSYAYTRYKWGTPSNCSPSRFIEEIDPAFIELPDKEEKNAMPRFQRKSYGVSVGSNGNPNHFEKTGNATTVNPGLQRKLTKLKTASAKAAENDSPFEVSDPDILEKGMTVEHQRFGTGTIASIEGNSPNKKATVIFNGAGQKQLLLKFAKLKIIN